jgi:hypothetical protein
LPEQSGGKKAGVEGGKSCHKKTPAKKICTDVLFYLF